MKTINVTVSAIFVTALLLYFNANATSPCLSQNWCTSFASKITINTYIPENKCIIIGQDDNDGPVFEGVLVGLGDPSTRAILALILEAKASGKKLCVKLSGTTTWSLGANRPLIEDVCTDQ